MFSSEEQASSFVNKDSSGVEGAALGGELEDGLGRAADGEASGGTAWHDWHVGPSANPSQGGSAAATAGSGGASLPTAPAEELDKGPPEGRPRERDSAAAGAGAAQDGVHFAEMESDLGLDPGEARKGGQQGAWNSETKAGAAAQEPDPSLSFVPPLVHKQVPAVRGHQKRFVATPARTRSGRAAERYAGLDPKAFTLVAQANEINETMEEMKETEEEL